jgi:hypothetical protein
LRHVPPHAAIERIQPKARSRVLDFDHRPGSGKTHNVMFLVNSGYSLARIRTEIEKCEVRCRNCHARVTYERDARDWRSALMRRREFPETR